MSSNFLIFGIGNIWVFLRSNVVIFIVKNLILCNFFAVA
jgi:hypothetical protein